MKTTAHKLIVTATVALFGLTVNAQNTRSIEHKLFSDRVAEFVSVKMEYAADAMSTQLANLKALVKYTPAEMNEENYSMEPSFDFASVSNELESSVKYTPTDNLDSAYEYTDNTESLNYIQDELESIVKYKPSDSVIDDSENKEMSEILDELSKFAKYTPAAVI